MSRKFLRFLDRHGRMNDLAPRVITEKIRKLPPPIVAIIVDIGVCNDCISAPKAGVRLED